MRKTLLTFVAFLLIAGSSVSAQSRDPYATDFSANYDFVYHEFSDTSNAGAHFDVATTIKRDVPFLSLAAEIGINHFIDANVSSYLGGVRLRIPNAGPSVLPFGQVLVGLYHCGPCAINDFALQYGGGLDFRISNNNAFRIRAQVDGRHMFDSFKDFNAVRVSAGVVLPLNR
ncbi:MAG TPA: hypothetical protein VNZ26_30140 [Vicinamibacterales bacterium]|nr:hypothetical protein [Vicinamibacterales bacterium]